MTRKRFVPLFAIASLTGSVLAADAPESDSPPLEASSQLHQFHDYMSRLIRDEQQRGAYLGVSTAQAPLALGRQLGLNRGMGLVVEFVAKDGPAEQAGVKQYDVLQKLDEQLLINSEQLAVLVRSYKPGDEVKLSLIREGKPQIVTVKLTEHELEPLRSMQSFDRWELDPQFTVPPASRAVPRPIPPAPNRTSSGNSTLTWLDGNRTYSITTRDGHRTITVTGKDDQIVFEGPLDTSEQRDRLPADVKEKVEKMAKSGLLPAIP